MTATGDPPAALDAAVVAGLLTSVQRRGRRAVEQTAAHLAAHGGYVSWSGGKDSTAALDVARQADPEVPVCFFDSGLEFPENIDYIHILAERWRLNLHVIPAVPDALTIMAATGAWDHHAPVAQTPVPDLHEALITAPARAARARFGHGEVWGLRAAESAGRRALLAPGRGCITRADGTVVFSPVWDWRDRDVAGYLAARGVPENPVYRRLRELGATGPSLRVGLAFDGNGLAQGRATWLRRGWPDVWARIVEALPRAAEWR